MILFIIRAWDFFDTTILNLVQYYRSSPDIVIIDFFYILYAYNLLFKMTNIKHIPSFIFLDPKGAHYLRET